MKLIYQKRFYPHCTAASCNKDSDTNILYQTFIFSDVFLEYDDQIQ